MKNTYWLIGPGNTFVQVEGADARDSLAVHGWTATDEPDSAATVWLRHNVTWALSALPYGALESWQARGWEFVVPHTEPGDQGPVVALPARPAEMVSEPAETPAAGAEVTTPPAAKPGSDKDKESSRGR